MTFEYPTKGETHLHGVARVGQRGPEVTDLHGIVGEHQHVRRLDVLHAFRFEWREREREIERARESESESEREIWVQSLRLRYPGSGFGVEG